jgi:hypothetical protein
MSNMQWNVDFFLNNNFIKKNHYNVVLFSIGHSSGENYVAIQSSLPQGKNNKMVVYVFFFGIRLRWPFDFP